MGTCGPHQEWISVEVSPYNFEAEVSSSVQVKNILLVWMNGMMEIPSFIYNHDDHEDEFFEGKDYKSMELTVVAEIEGCL